MAERYVTVESSRFSDSLSLGNPDNYYGRILLEQEDGERLPVICGHGGSMWLCKECALAIQRGEVNA